MMGGGEGDKEDKEEREGAKDDKIECAKLGRKVVGNCRDNYLAYIHRQTDGWTDGHKFIYTRFAYIIFHRLLGRVEQFMVAPPTGSMNEAVERGRGWGNSNYTPVCWYSFEVQ